MCQPSTSQDDEPQPPESVSSGAAREAAFSIEPAAALLVGANPVAQRLLRLPAGLALPHPLDAAMPAIRRLRALAAQLATEPGTNAQEELQFWCAGRIVRLKMKIQKDTMRNGMPGLILRALPEAEAEAERADTPAAAVNTLGTETMRTAAVSPPVDGDAPRIVRDDRDTLREIARRIREGYRPDREAVRPETAPDAPAAPATSEPPREVIPPMSGRDAGKIDAPSIETPQDHALKDAALPLRDLAQAADSRTLAKVAHELKTPLSAIVAAAEIMRDERLGQMGNPTYLGYASDIYDSARHALDVISAMLNGAARETRTLSRVKLAELAAATVSVLQPLARSSGIELEAHCADDDIEITGDATGVRQILYNLVSNALKFTPRGGAVHVVTDYLDDGVPFLVVRDTGEGMTEDAIINAFYRDEGEIAARPGGGYGIGLPLVRKLAEMMQATIDVDSEPGKGTAVLVSFPNR